MKNDIFSVQLDPTSGCVTSLMLQNDPHNMNWCMPGALWGEPVILWRLDFQQHWDGNELLSFEESDDRSTAVIQNGKVTITVERDFAPSGNFRERYTLQSNEPYDLFLQTGEVGLRVPFADFQLPAKLSQTNACDAHVWCGENVSWINALRQGKSEQNLGLVLTEGSIDLYSIEHLKLPKVDYRRNQRGSIILHPKAADLLPDDRLVIEWEIFPHKGNADFIDKLTAYKYHIYPVADNYTVFDGEDFRFTFKTDAVDVRVTLDGAPVPFVREGDTVTVTHTPQKWGEHIFNIDVDGVKTHITLFAAKAFEELIRERIHFIVDHQQYHRAGSHLDGAYLIYDNETKRCFFDDRLGDHNASAERLGMGLFIARWLQTHTDQKVYDSLMEYVAFIKREILDEETGTVFFSIGRDLRRVRLYNAPWMMTFMCELYTLTGDKTYLETLLKITRKYYEQGGAKWYPNGISIKDIVKTVRGAGEDAMADELQELFFIHADNMLKTGLDYPEMECIFEQTIVTPAVAFLCDAGILKNDPAYVDHLADHIEVLARFDGMQPDHRLNGIAIRHWDDYWFGKAGIMGDTLPHYWACLTARSWRDYAELSGDTSYIPRAQNAMRNCLCAIREDGSGSCAYVYPFKVDGKRAALYDPWANDQDFGLYFALQIL